MRIAIINSHYYPDEHGGAERSLRFLAEAAVALGHECTVFATGDARESTELNGVGIERFGLRKRPTESAAARAKLMWHLRDTYSSAGAVEMANAIRRFAPHVAHTNNLSGISVALWGAEPAGMWLDGASRSSAVRRVSPVVTCGPTKRLRAPLPEVSTT